MLRRASFKINKMKVLILGVKFIQLTWFIDSGAVYKTKYIQLMFPFLGGAQYVRKIHLAALFFYRRHSNIYITQHTHKKKTSRTK